MVRVMRIFAASFLVLILSFPLLILYVFAVIVLVLRHTLYLPIRDFIYFNCTRGR